MEPLLEGCMAPAVHPRPVECLALEGLVVWASELLLALDGMVQPKVVSVQEVFESCGVLWA
eukprot:33949-Eustigmatos_ZCMA.PRE.1